MAEITAGIFLFIKNKFLVGHITNAPSHVWSIPKGLVDENENIFDAAKRELKEETNIDFNKLIINKEIISLPSFKYKKINKTLAPFYIEIENKCSDFDLKCNSFVPPKNFPEIDDFKWVSIEEGYEILNETQKRTLNYLTSNGIINT